MNWYESTADQVLTVAGSLLQCREDAEEIAVEVYLVAHQQAAAFDATRGPLRSWLCRIARNKAIDRYRRRRTMVSLDDPEQAGLADALAGEAPHIDAELMQSESSLAVYRSLKVLTPQRRRIIGLAFFLGLSHQQIAEKTGMPLGTVKSHIKRALASLKAEMMAHA